MRLTVILVLAACFKVSATGYAQEITIKAKDMPCESVFREITRQSGYQFFFNKRLIRNARNVSVELNAVPVEKAIEICFANQPFDFAIVNKTVVIRKKNPRASAKPETATAEIPPVTIRGKITDEQGNVLPGASVSVKGTNTTTVANGEGVFTIEANTGDRLEISFVGFESREVVVGSVTSLQVMLKAVNAGLNEVVVVGYGTQKKVNLTGAISVVNSKDLENKPLTNSSQALYNVDGVFVSQPGGNPGHDVASISIRGIGTLGSGSKLQPLVLIDEVESNLQNINPQDIESISVLKDASSTAIYGSRAANGVILIKTKSGRKNENLKIHYSGYAGVQKPTYLPDPVSSSAEFMRGYNQALINQGGAAYYSDELIEEFKNSSTSILHPNTDWMDVLFGSALIQEHNIRFSGGSEKTTYNVLAGYLDQNGVLKDMTGSKKYNLSMNINSEVSKRFGFNVRVALNRRDVTQPSEGIDVAMNRITRMVPIQPVGKMDNGDWPDSWVLTPGQNSFQNPLVFKKDSYGREVNYHLLSSISAYYNLSPNLKYKIQGSMVYNNGLEKNFMPVIWLHNVRTSDKTRSPYSTVGYKTEINNDQTRLNLIQTIEYAKSISAAHNFLFLFGNSIENFETASRTSRKTGYEIFNLDELSVGTGDPSSSGNSTDDRLSSFFGRVQYNFKDKYLFEFNSRFDGSSRFSEGNRWSYFPSFSLGWRLSEEDFFKNIKWTNELKIRGSWGKIGNQEIGRFQYVNSISFGYGYPFGGVYDGAGVAITQIKDPKIKWETTAMTDIGLDWTGFNNRLSFSIDFYSKMTNDILRTINIPAQVGGLAGPTTNVAKVSNKGIDASINYKGNIGALGFSVGGFVSTVRNKVVALNGEVLFSGSRITKEGYPIDSWYIYETDGLFQSEEELSKFPRITSRVGVGDVKYVDRNGDKVINGDDRYIAGNSFPDFIYGFNLNFQLKGFSLLTQWQGVQNIDVWWSGNLILPYNNGAGVTKEWLYGSWTPDNPNAKLPRLTTRHQYTAENFSPSDYWLQDASYLRLKNIQLKYDFAHLKFMNLRKVSVFINAQNILTISPMKDFDPEQDVKVEHINKYPSIKTISGGVVIDF